MCMTHWGFCEICSFWHYFFCVLLLIFLFSLITISGGELHKLHDFLCFTIFLFNYVTFSGAWVTRSVWLLCIDYFSLMLSPCISESELSCIRTYNPSRIGDWNQTRLARLELGYRTSVLSPDQCKSCWCVARDSCQCMSFSSAWMLRKCL